MRLSLSCRISESFLDKRHSILSLDELADLAVAAGYEGLCMRPSQVSIHSARDQIRQAREILDRHSLPVSMITGDFDIVYNNERGPTCLANIEPHLELADALGARLIRVCLKSPDDIYLAQQAADAAARRGLRLVHQCHVQSLFETVDQIVATLDQIDRPNFGLIYEPANLEECRQDYGPATVRRLAPWIFNVYLQNQQLHAQGQITLDTWSHGPVAFDVIPIDRPGGIDFERVLAGLKEIDYRGPITVHQSAPEEGGCGLLEAAARTAAFLKSKW